MTLKICFKRSSWIALEIFEEKKLTETEQLVQLFPVWGLCIGQIGMWGDGTGFVA